MVEDNYRINDNLLVEQNEDEYVLKFRKETGRGKRYGMDGSIPLDESSAETLAKWVFAQQLKSSSG